MTILVDHRERSSGVVDALSELSVDLRVTSLPLADYIVARGVGVERKTVADLHRSVHDGRLWTQVASLRVDLAISYLLVEGRDLDAGPISRAGIRGALLEVVRLGIPVLRSMDIRDTALWLERISLREARGAARSPGRPSRTRLGRPVTSRTLLSQIPGISPRTAKALLERFGSIAGTAMAGPEELMSIEGVGRERARAIRELLTGGADIQS